MNERLKELIAQSYTDEQGERFDPQRLAELIVRECVTLCEKEHAPSIHTHAGAWNTAINRCKKSISERFGVAE